jgi:hypothetical protein
MRLVHLIVPIVFFSLSAFASTQAKMTLITELPRNEPHNGLTVNGPYVFTGVSRQEEGEKHHIDVFHASSLKLVQRFDLQHSVQEIKPFGASAVLVLGKSSVPQWQSHFSVIDWASGSLKVRLFSVPYEVMAESFAGDPSNIYFNEPGSRGVYRWSNNRLNTVSEGVISGPGVMQFRDGNLWVLERGGLFAYGDENLVHINTRTGTLTRPFDQSNIRGAADIALSTDGRYLAVTMGGGKPAVKLYDVQTNTFHSGLSLDHWGDRLATFGQCVVSLSPEDKTIEFMHIESAALTKIAEWSLSEAGDRLKNPQTLSIDTENKRIIVRSAYPCPSCTATQSSVFAAEDDGSTFAKCLN